MGGHQQRPQSPAAWMSPAAQLTSTMAHDAVAATTAGAVWGGLQGCGIVERLHWIFVGKVEESMNTNSNHKLHAKSHMLRGGATHFARAPPSRDPAVPALSTEVKPKTVSCHNQKTDTMAQPEKVSPAHVQRAYVPKVVPVDMDSGLVHRHIG